MKIFNDEKSVSEILGTLLLLIIAVIVVSSIIFTVINSLDDKEEPEVNIFGRMDGEEIILEHQGGELLDNKTKMIINVGGQNLTPIFWNNFTINNGAGENISNVGKWDIGNYLTYTLFDTYKGKYVDVYIIEDKSGSTVFYARVREGGPFLLRGGIWHFDEGEGFIAYDSLNDNDGKVNDLESWNTTISAAGDSCMHFDGYNQTVKVNHDGTLLMTENITIKASLIPEETRGFIDSYTIDEVKFGQTPSILRINDNLVAITMENQHKKGTLITIALDKDGLINKEVVNISNFTGTMSKNHPVHSRLIHLTNNIFVLVYTDIDYSPDSNTIFLKLYEILDDGNITYLDKIIDLPIKTPYPENYPNNIPQLVKIDEDTIAVTYSNLNQSGVLYALNVSINEGFNISSSWENYDYYCNEPSMLLLDDDTIVIAYRRDSLQESVIFPINVTANGFIYKSSQKETFNVEYNQPTITKIDDETILLSYRNRDDEGIITTINISSENIVTPTDYSFLISETKYNEELYSDSFNYPDICNLRENIYSMTFTTAESYVGNSQGYFLTFELNDIGNFINISDLSRFESNFCLLPKIEKINDLIVGVVYEGQSQKGILKTLYLGDLYTPPIDRGFVKKGSYGFWANTKTIYAWINNKILTLPVEPDVWNNIVFTYNYSDNTVTLYNYYKNKVKTNTSKYYNKINIRSSDLLFGYQYRGFIDEIYILDEAYTPD